MTITINGTTGITTPELTLDNTAADGGQVVLKSSGYSNWNIDNYSGRLRGYYGSTEYFTVDASGNVGIGTGSPSFVAGSTGLQINGSSAPTVRLSSPTSNIEVLSATNASYVWVTSNTPLVFGTNATERARIDTSGNLLVGTTSAFAAGKLTVEASNSFYSFASNQTGSGQKYHVVFGSSGTVVGSITSSGSTTSYTTSSDYRLKENIQPMTGALAKVAALKPVTYKWKVDGSDGEGFIAHELQAVVPDCVTGEKDAVDADGNPVYQSIDTSFLVATLTAAIQEQQAIIESLKTRIETLENK